MLANVLISLAVILIVSDSRSTRSIDYQTIFDNSKSMMLEQPEAGSSGINLLNSGDYSGCMEGRLVQAAGRTTATLRSRGIVEAVMHVRKSVSTSKPGF